MALENQTYVNNTTVHCDALIVRRTQNGHVTKQAATVMVVTGCIDATALINAGIHLVAPSCITI